MQPMTPPMHVACDPPEEVVQAQPDEQEVALEKLKIEAEAALAEAERQHALAQKAWAEAQEAYDRYSGQVQLISTTEDHPDRYRVKGVRDRVNVSMRLVTLAGTESVGKIIERLHRASRRARRELRDHGEEKATYWRGFRESLACFYPWLSPQLGLLDRNAERYGVRLAKGRRDPDREPEVD